MSKLSFSSVIFEYGKILDVSHWPAPNASRDDRSGCSNLCRSVVTVLSLLANTSAGMLFSTPKLVPRIPEACLFILLGGGKAGPCS